MTMLIVPVLSVGYAVILSTSDPGCDHLCCLPGLFPPEPKKKRKQKNVVGQVLGNQQGSHGAIWGSVCAWAVVVLLRRKCMGSWAERLTAPTTELQPDGCGCLIENCGGELCAREHRTYGAGTTPFSSRDEGPQRRRIS
jgi:hypothetical protein